MKACDIARRFESRHRLSRKWWSTARPKATATRLSLTRVTPLLLRSVLAALLLNTRVCAVYFCCPGPREFFCLRQVQRGGHCMACAAAVPAVQRQARQEPPVWQLSYRASASACEHSPMLSSVPCHRPSGDAQHATLTCQRVWLRTPTYAA